MSEEYVFVLPYPPSVNSYYGHTAIRVSGRNIIKTYIKEKGRNYRKEVIKIIKEKGLELRANVNLQFEVILTPPDNRTRDIDNILKSLLDSLTHSNVIEDDCFIRKLNISYVEKDSYEKPGSVLVHMKAL